MSTRPGARRPRRGIWGCQAVGVGEGAGDGGGPAGYLQQAVDVFQVRAHSCLGDAQAALADFDKRAAHYQVLDRRAQPR